MTVSGRSGATTLGFAQLRLFRAETIDVGECQTGQLFR